jgi:hypothetical protein
MPGEGVAWWRLPLGATPQIRRSEAGTGGQARVGTRPGAITVACRASSFSPCFPTVGTTVDGSIEGTRTTGVDGEERHQVTPDATDP